MQIRSATCTDIGKVRRRNEDRFVCDDDLRLYGVADGIGGLPGGAEAAQHTITHLRNAIEHISKNAPETLADTPIDLDLLTQNLNQSVNDLALRMGNTKGMGTTLTYGLLRNKHLHLAHVGDSRCYLLRDNELTQLSTDHTVENEIRRLRAAGQLATLNESERQSLTRCIGQDVPLEVDILQCRLRADDRYLFCTDGIDKAIERKEIAAILGQKNTPEQILEKLIALANARGGYDNATGVLVFVDAV